MTDQSETTTCRGVRGATIAAANTPDAILEATRELLATVAEANDIVLEDVASIFFTMTPDLNATYPAYAARQLGWDKLPLLCAQEIDVADGHARVIRILLHWNTTVPQDAIKHMYINGAETLRPDLAARAAGVEGV